MNSSQMNLIYVFLVMIFIASLFLQIYLSKRKDKISGLILPIIYFLRSFRSVFELWWHDIAFAEIIPILLLQNIPTLILIAIYILYRRRINRNKEIEKMNIQDLE